MIAEPQTLPGIGGPVTRGASRKDGPQTSRDAGRSMSGHVLRDQQALVLRTLGSYCRTYEGGTAWELWGALEGDPARPKENVLVKRLGELRDAGLVRVNVGVTRPGSSFRHQQEWTLTDLGHEYLRDRGAA